MIRFIDLGEQIYCGGKMDGEDPKWRRFAFYDTVTCLFMHDDCGCVDFGVGEVFHFHGPGRQERVLSLCPDWVFGGKNISEWREPCPHCNTPREARKKKDREALGESRE